VFAFYSWAGNDHKEAVDDNFVKVYGEVIKRLIGKDGQHFGGIAMHFLHGAREQLLKGDLFHHSMLFVTSGRELFVENSMVPAVIFKVECVLRMDMSGGFACSSAICVHASLRWLRVR